MSLVECYVCKKTIDRDRDLHCSLGTHNGKLTTDMQYFHFNCWRKHFEDKTREKAQNIVNGMQERMQPIAQQLIGKLTGAIEEKSYEIK